MKIRSMVLSAAAALGLGAAVWIAPHALAQEMWDIVKVNVPYPVILNGKTLPPAEYTIKQQQGPGNSPVLEIYNADGTKFETAAMTVHTVDPNTPEKTSVSFHHIGDNYYLDKIWVEGKNYGYQVPLPDSVRERETEAESVSVPAQVSTTSAAATAADTSTAPPPPPPATDNTTATTPEPTPAPEPAPQATAAPQPAPAADVQQPAPASPDENSANREKRADDTGSTPDMPATSAGWLAMLLSGGSLSGAGLMLRRKRR
jgi:hypothetical protein